MSVSRRKLLRNGVAAAVACIARPMWGLGGPKMPDLSGDTAARTRLTEKPEAMTRDFFSQAIGSGFKVSQASGNFTPVYLRLMKIQDPPAITPPNVGQMAVPPKQTSYTVTDGFMLSFYGSFPETLPQGKYIFEHNQLGKFELFIVPDGPGSQSYTAVIAFVGQTLSIDGVPAVAPSVVQQPPIGPPRVQPSTDSTAPGRKPGPFNGSASASQPTQREMEPAVNRIRTEMPE